MPKKRIKPKDNSKRAKKKISILDQERISYVDWKDVDLLRRFISDRAKIRARRVTGNSVQQQSDVAMAIKNAREMALLPYASRVTQQRGGRKGGRDGGRDRDRDGDRDGPPVPKGPPPGRDRDGDDVATEAEEVES